MDETLWRPNRLTNCFDAPFFDARNTCSVCGVGMPSYGDCTYCVNWYLDQKKWIDMFYTLQLAMEQMHLAGGRDYRSWRQDVCKEV